MHNVSPNQGLCVSGFRCGVQKHLSASRSLSRSAQGSGFRVQGSGSKIQGSGSRVQGTSFPLSSSTPAPHHPTSLVSGPPSSSPTSPPSCPNPSRRTTRCPPAPTWDGVWGVGHSHVEPLIIHELGFNQNLYTFSFILLSKIVLCGKFH